MTIDSYESLYYDRGHEGVKHTIDNLQYDNDKLRKALKVYEEKRYQEHLENEQLHSIIKEIRETLNNKRNTLTEQLLYRGYCNYEELLYQVDEEIRKILDKVGDNNE